MTVYPLIKQAGVAYKKQAAQLDTNAIYLGICTVNPQITHKCTWGWAQRLVFSARMAIGCIWKSFIHSARGLHPINFHCWGAYILSSLEDCIKRLSSSNAESVPFKITLYPHRLH